MMRNQIKKKKVGRNDPCPCGSGKKYKKCCIDQPKIELPNRLWQPDHLEEMDTKIIIRYLQTYGIPLNQQELTSEILSVDTAEDLCLQWMDTYRLDTSDRMIDFTFLAIIELAYRLTPDHILIEQLDRLMEEGYEHSERNESKQALKIWQKTWDELLKWAKQNEFNSIERLTDYGKRSMHNFVSNWIQDFLMELRNESIQDNRYLLTCKKVADELLIHFPKSEEYFIALGTQYKAESLFKLGKVNEAEQLYEEHINLYPNNPWMYVYWGDLHNPHMFFPIENKAQDKDKAISLYEKAIKHMEDEGDREAVVERLNELV